MRVAFRTDASVLIGSGHVMRCLTLADALRKEGVETLFLSQSNIDHLAAEITARGHHLVWLPHGESQSEDAQHTIAALGVREPVDWLVVDHYARDRIWESAVRQACRRLMVIDDLANRMHDCDLLLDQNLQAPGRYDSLVMRHVPRLLGPKYALLRPQFGVAREHLRLRDGKVTRLLVFCGGADASGETMKALAAIDGLSCQSIFTDVVIGSANPHHAEIVAYCTDRPNVALHCQVEDMAGRMAVADLFVGVGGTSSWERCCMGLPAVVWASAENQYAQCEILARDGAHLYLGKAHEVTVRRLRAVLDEVIQQPELLDHLARQSRALVDGMGADRVAARLLSDALSLRRAVEADCANVFGWRNHPDTRRYALDPTEIDFQSHEQWFSKVIKDPSRMLLIAELKGTPVGVLRFDIQPEGQALISIYLVPGMSGKGWGLRVLLSGEHWLKQERPEIQQCEAEIVGANRASLAFFDAAGYKLERSVYRKVLREIN